MRYPCRPNQKHPTIARYLAGIAEAHHRALRQAPARTALSPSYTGRHRCNGNGFRSNDENTFIAQNRDTYGRLPRLWFLGLRAAREAGKQDQDQAVKQERDHQRSGVAEAQVFEEKLYRAEGDGGISHPT